ncbi:MAG: spore cortex biosynthesis protein YabQ [Lachnospiraceae bacterium]
MSTVIVQEIHFWLISLAAGAAITFVYDLLRIFRRVISHGNFWIGVEDLLFWVGTAFWCFFIFYRENDGSIRMYAMIAMGGGMLIYHQLISEWFVKWVSCILNKVLRFLVSPLFFLENKLKKGFKRAIMKFKNQKHREKQQGSDTDGNADKP